MSRRPLGTRRGDDLIAQAEHELDLLDSQIIAEQRQRVRELRPQLAALGFDVSGFTEPAWPHPLERRSRPFYALDPHAARAAADAAKRGVLVRPGLGHVTGIR